LNPKESKKIMLPLFLMNINNQCPISLEFEEVFTINTPLVSTLTEGSLVKGKHP
jgi:hypothetical protein